MEEKTVKILNALDQKANGPFEWSVEIDGEQKKLSSWDKRELESGETYKITLLDEDAKNDVTYNQRRMSKKHTPVKMVEPERTLVEERPLSKPTENVDKKPKPPVEDDFDELYGDLLNDDEVGPHNDQGSEIVEFNDDKIEVTKGSIISLETQKQIFASKWALFNYVKNTVIKPDDWFNGQYLKKSGFRKFAQAFRLQLKVIDKKLEQFDPPLIIRATQDYKYGPKKGDKIELDWQYSVVVRVYMPDVGFGEAYAEQIGVVGSWDNNAFQSPHNALGKAVTRAYSRAIADLVGYGVYSESDL